MSGVRRPRVAVRLRDGLGNHLFQYAAALSIADLDATRVEIVNIEDAHPLLQPLLGQELRPSPTAQTTAIMHLGRRGVRKARKMLGVPSKSRRHITQHPSNAFDAIDEGINLATGPIELNGYFQHPSWYEPSLGHIAARVHHFLREQPEYEMGIGSTVISFRRGDYVRYGWDMGVSYYLRAIEQIPLAGQPIWVIGDDQFFNRLAAEWLRSNGFEAWPAPASAAASEVRDACLLAAAESVVMSNSTFCWWGVVAREHATQTASQCVLAPERWMPYLPSNPLLSSTWHSIPTTFGSEGDAVGLTNMDLADTRFVARRAVSRQ